jgi:ribonuclease HI
VTFDASLTFAEHARGIKQRVTKRVGLLRRLRGKAWGCSMGLLLQVFKAYVAPVAAYGSSTWAVFAATTNLDSVQAALNDGGRLALRCPRGTNNAALHAEMGVLPIGIHGQVQAAILRERALRLVPEAPIHETTINHTRPRLKARNGKYHLRVEVPATQGPAVVVHRGGLPARCRTEWPGDPTNHCASCLNPRRKQACLRRLSLPDLVTPPLVINQQPLVIPQRCVTEWPDNQALHCASCLFPRRKKACLRRAAAKSATVGAAVPVVRPPPEPDPPPITDESPPEIVLWEPGSALVLRRKTWRDAAVTIATAAGLEGLRREPLAIHKLSTAPHDHVDFTLDHDISTSRDDPPEVRRHAATATLNALPVPDISVWTDGSAAEGFRNGGGGIVVDFNASDELVTWAIPTGKVTSSFKAECCALLSALEWLTVRLAGADHKVIHCHTDSRSALQSLANGPGSQSHITCAAIWEALRLLKHCQVRLIWVPGHAGLAGNERADREAALGGAMAQETTAIDLPCAITAIKRIGSQLQRDWYQHHLDVDHHHRRATDGQPFVFGKRCTWVNRCLILLRVNRHPDCRATLARWKRIDPATGLLYSPTCHLCGAACQDAAHIIIHCPHHAAERANHLPGKDISCLHRFPDKVVGFLCSIGFLEPRYGALGANS